MADTEAKEVPGSLGLPKIGAILDRIEYFKNGAPEFFRKRIKIYESTVIRVNMPPGPPIVGESNVVMLLDAKCFNTLFDLSKVEKKNCLTGYYMPDLKFFGGYKTTVYMDPSEEGHSRKKEFCMSLLAKSFNTLGPEFDRVFKEFCLEIEKDIAAKGSAKFGNHISQFLFNLLCRTIAGADPVPVLGNKGPSYTEAWLAPQLAPLASSGVLPKFLDALTIHSIRLPFFAISSSYTKLCNFIKTYASTTVAKAHDTFQITQNEALHELIFNLGFNAFGGMMIFFPSLLTHLAMAGPDLHCRLTAEARAEQDLAKAIMEGNRLSLARSCVYEVLRLNPPVELQYGWAKKDMNIESTTGVYRLHKGQLLGGYQPFATRDPTLFDRAEEFVGDRFVDEEKRRRLLPHVLWSNGPQTEDPGIANKQCPAKDFVVTVATLFVANLFKRYDSFDLDRRSSAMFPVMNSLSRSTSPGDSSSALS